MGRWAYALLLATMAAWTLFTGVAGWYAFRGSTSSAHAGDENFIGIHDIVAPDGTRELRELTLEDAIYLINLPDDLRPDLQAAAEAEPTPGFRSTGGAQPVPRHAGSAGFDTRVRPANGEVLRPKESPARTSSRGVVVLDPGHGRGDPGAVHHLPDGSYDITEAESNLMNAELIRDELVAMGYEVYLTREGEGRGPGRPLPLQFIASDLYARVALVRAVEADVFLSIHGNGAVVKSISGPETWYCGKHSEGNANQRLAELVQQAMMNALHEYGYFPPDRGIKEDAKTHHSGGFCQFVVTRETPVPSALLEFLFLSNDADAAVLVDPRSHELLAKHVAAAIDTFMRERRGE